MLWLKSTEAIVSNIWFPAWTITCSVHAATKTVFCCQPPAKLTIFKEMGMIRPVIVCFHLRGCLDGTSAGGLTVEIQIRWVGVSEAAVTHVTLLCSPVEQTLSFEVNQSCDCVRYARQSINTDKLIFDFFFHSVFPWAVFNRPTEVCVIQGLMEMQPFFQPGWIGPIHPPTHPTITWLTNLLLKMVFNWGQWEKVFHTASLFTRLLFFLLHAEARQISPEASHGSQSSVGVFCPFGIKHDDINLPMFSLENARDKIMKETNPFVPEGIPSESKWWRHSAKMPNAKCVTYTIKNREIVFI